MYDKKWKDGAIITLLEQKLFYRAKIEIDLCRSLK